MSDYPQWVRERACELANVKNGQANLWEPRDVGNPQWANITVIADLILKYETAPVDPDEALVCEVLRSAVPTYRNQTDACIKSISRRSFSITLAAIKLARERNAL